MPVDVADAAGALCYGHLVEGWAEFDGVADVSAVAAAFVGLGAWDGFACCWGEGGVGGHGGGGVDRSSSGLWCRRFSCVLLTHGCW